LESLSRYGQTTVSNCRMIEALMYGITPSANTVICERLRPENMSYKPSRLLDAACSAHS
jgi:hypothetical protein